MMIVMGVVRNCTDSRTHPKVVPDTAMYCPRVLMMPLWPGPYLKILTVPTDDPVSFVASHHHYHRTPYLYPHNSTLD